MQQTIRLSFSGTTELEQMDVPYEPRRQALSFLQGHSDDIASEIADRLAAATGVSPGVHIVFEEGSLDWRGLVEWAGQAWPVIEAMAAVGGAIQLVQIVRGAIDRVLRRWLARAVQTSRLQFPTQTQVILVSVPTRRTRALASIDSMTFFGIAAIMIGLAAVVASVGYVLSAVR